MIKDNLTVLETENLVIRKFDKSDFRNFLSLHQDSEIMKYFDGGHKTLEQSRKRFEEIMEHQKKYGFSYFNVFLNNSGEYIGQAGLYYNYDMSVNLCYAFLPKYYGRGYATEAIIGVIKFGFEKLNLNLITVMSTHDNVRSRNLLKKVGAEFIKEITFLSGTKALLHHINKKSFKEAISSLKIYEYRKSVGAILRNKFGLIYFFQRSDFSNTWQCPEGGIDNNETPLEAVYREIKEEIGISKDKLKFIAETENFYKYNYIDNKINNGYVGQQKKFFLFDYTGEEKDFVYNSHFQEFKNFALLSKEEAIELVPNFKQELYKIVFKEFDKHLS